MIKEVKFDKVDGQYSEQKVSLKFKRLSKDDILITQMCEFEGHLSEVSSIVHQYDLVSLFYIFNHIDCDEVDDERLNDLIGNDVEDRVNIKLFEGDIDVTFDNEGWDYICITSTNKLPAIIRKSRSYVRREVLNTFRFMAQFMRENEWRELDILIVEGI